MECPVAIECRVSKVVPMGSHDVFVADIVGASVDEKYFDEAGKIHLEWAHLLAYMHGEYFSIGRRVGKFGYAATNSEKGGVKGKITAPRESASKEPSAKKKATVQKSRSPELKKKPRRSKKSEGRRKK